MAAQEKCSAYTERAHKHAGELQAALQEANSLRCQLQQLQRDNDTVWEALDESRADLETREQHVEDYRAMTDKAMDAAVKLRVRFDSLQQQLALVSDPNAAEVRPSPRCCCLTAKK